MCCVSLPGQCGAQLLCSVWQPSYRPPRRGPSSSSPTRSCQQTRLMRWCSHTPAHALCAGSSWSGHAHHAATVQPCVCPSEGGTSAPSACTARGPERADLAALLHISARARVLISPCCLAEHPHLPGSVCIRCHAGARGGGGGLWAECCALRGEVAALRCRQQGHRSHRNGQQWDPPGALGGS